MQVHLLVADDNDSHRESIRLTLEAQGYVVAPAASGTEALEVARRIPIDCALLDYRIGDMTGLELFRRLVATRASLPSILMSAELERTLRADALLAGFSQCLTKPISVDDLRATVALVLRGTRPPMA